MKITFVMASGFSLSGGDRVIATYAERLKKRGHDVLVISPPRRKPKLQQQFKHQMKLLLKGQSWGLVKQKQQSHFDNIGVECRTLDSWRPVTDSDVPDADVVIATWWETAEWVASLSPAKGAKVYFIQHYETFDYLPKERVAATWSLPLHKITIAQWLVDLAQTKYGDYNVSLVPNSVEQNLFYAPPRGKQAVPTVGMLYAEAYWKGCDISLKAFSLAAQKIPNLRLVAFGNSRISPRLPLPNNAKYEICPAQIALKEIYASCDVWLCGSWSEGFHLPPLEAMACRCPVVSTAVGGPLDVVKEGINGHLVPVGDYTALSNHLVRVLTLPEAEWKKMSDAAYYTATSYTWDDATSLFEAALYTAIKREKRGELKVEWQ